MPKNQQKLLQKYATLVIKSGLNLQPGQRLIITNISFGWGVSFDAAPLVREIVTSAYQAGARFVEVLWDDRLAQRVRYQEAASDSFDEYPTWRSQALEEYTSGGDALLTILAEDPDFLTDQDPEVISIVRKTSRTLNRVTGENIARNATNWAVISAAAPGWAAKVFPGAPKDQQLDHLWQAIFKTCRLDQPDPIAAWEAHKKDLAVKRTSLTERAYNSLHFRAPGTDLILGLPKDHLWGGGTLETINGLSFIPNLPTEEIFTMPHKNKAEGTVRASMPLHYGGTLIEDIQLIFKEGKVIQASASKGETLLHRLLETDEGVTHLGEVALVPQSSPIAQSGILFYNTLFDENAACHLALGRAYQFCMQDGKAMTLDEFAAAGGNYSIAHVDFMIGSDEMDIDGLWEDGGAEPLMRAGEWVTGI